MQHIIFQGPPTAYYYVSNLLYSIKSANFYLFIGFKEILPYSIFITYAINILPASDPSFVFRTILLSLRTL